MGTPISGLPAVTTPLVGSELIDIVQAGETRKATVQNVVDLALAEDAGTSTEVHALPDLSDVLISSPADGDVLTYDSLSNLWINLPSSGGSLPGTGSEPFVETLFRYNNLSDVDSPAIARRNLGVPSTIFDQSTSYVYGGSGTESMFSNNIPSSADPGGLAAVGEKIEAWYTGVLHVTGCSLELDINGNVQFTTGSISCSADSAFLLHVVLMRTGATTTKAVITCLVNGVTPFTAYYDDTAVTFSSTIPMVLKGLGGIIPGLGDLQAHTATGQWIPKA